jgi:5-formyltetrahydrofolate cyclo-ligase
MQSWTDVNAWRKARRAELRERRLALPPAERRALQARILAHIEAGFPELAGAPVGFYWPFRGEVDLQPLMKRHVAAGGRAALPVVVERKEPVEWWEWSPGTRMVPGIWDIPVPAERRLLEPAVLLVPVLGFDWACYRLGNGGGYYDRTLAAMQPRPLAIGVGYELGRLETIHPQPHDIPLHAVVTETGLHWPLAGALGADGAAVSSPVCYADEAAPEYFGYLSREETLALLNELLEAERAGVKVAGVFAGEQEGDAAASLAALQRDEARCCGLLARLIRHLDGEMSRATGAFQAKALAVQGGTERLRFLNRGQGWVVRRLQEALPRIRDEAVHAGLQQMLELHERNVAHCDALIARLG